MRNVNQALIQEATNEMNGWRNDSGAFYPYQHDMGNQVYHAPATSPVEVSLPHILNIEQGAAGFLTVNLLGAASNYTAANFGNNVNVNVTYTSNNPAQPFTYENLLAATLAEPQQIGLVRIQAVTSAQATQTLSLLRNPGVGKFQGQSMFPLIYPNQYLNNITYLDQAWKADKFTTLSYLQNGTTDENIQIYLYQNSNISMDRVFSNKKVVKEFAKPQTGISNQTQVVQASPATISERMAGLFG